MDYMGVNRTFLDIIVAWANEKKPERVKEVER
jgi:hypothetical protein